MFHLFDKNIPLQEKSEIAILLTIVGGFLDAYSFLCYGGVFANTQTGNIVFLSISLINNYYIKSLHYLIPILAFAIGILLADFLLNYFSRSFFTWVLFIEIVILFIIAFLPEGIPNVIATVLISFICAIQIGGFRKICGTPYTSTMCTGNLRSAMNALFIFLIKKEKLALDQFITYLSIIVTFCIGAALGAFFVNIWGKRSVFICCILLSILLCLMVKNIISSKKEQHL